MWNVARLASDVGSLPDNDARVWARALMGYNGGGQGIHNDYDDIVFETRYYGDHFIRLPLTAEAVSRMRTKGMSDKKVAEGMHHQ